MTVSTIEEVYEVPHDVGIAQKAKKRRSGKPAPSPAQKTKIPPRQSVVHPMINYKSTRMVNYRKWGVPKEVIQ